MLGTKSLKFCAAGRCKTWFYLFKFHLVWLSDRILDISNDIDADAEMGGENPFGTPYRSKSKKGQRQAKGKKAATHQSTAVNKKAVATSTTSAQRTASGSKSTSVPFQVRNFYLSFKTT